MHNAAARPTERGGGVSRGGAPGSMSLGGPNKQVESCFLNHNSSIHFCCTDSLLMTHRGRLSLSIIIWRIGGGGGEVSFCPGAQKLAALAAAMPSSSALFFAGKVIYLYIYIYIV